MDRSGVLVTAPSVADCVATMLRRKVTAMPVPIAPFTAAFSGVLASFVTDDNGVVVLAIMDMPLAAALGLAPLQLPVAMARDIIRTGKMTGDPFDGLCETLNVLSVLFQPKGVHVVLRRTVVLKAPLSPEMIELFSRDWKRLDFSVDLPGYGGGRLTLIGEMLDNGERPSVAAARVARAKAMPVKPLVTPVALRDLLSGFIHRKITVDDIAPQPIEPQIPQALAVYHRRDGTPGALVIADLALIGTLGAAPILLPQAQAEETMRTGKPTPDIADGFRESCNMLSKLFAGDDFGGLRLGDLHWLPTELATSLSTPLDAPKACCAFTVAVAEYGQGRMQLFVP